MDASFTVTDSIDAVTDSRGAVTADTGLLTVSTANTVETIAEQMIEMLICSFGRKAFPVIEPDDLLIFFKKNRTIFD